MYVKWFLNFKLKLIENDNIYIYRVFNFIFFIILVKLLIVKKNYISFSIFLFMEFF